MGRVVVFSKTQRLQGKSNRLLAAPYQQFYSAIIFTSTNNSRKLSTPPNHQDFPQIFIFKNHYLRLCPNFNINFLNPIWPFAPPILQTMCCQEDLKTFSKRCTMGTCWIPHQLSHDLLHEYSMLWQRSTLYHHLRVVLAHSRATL